MSEEQVISKKQVIVSVAAAGVGGIAPNLLSLAVMLTAGNVELPQWTFYPGLLIFAVIGAAVGFFWQETDPKRAFYLGIALPALIQLGGSNLKDQPVPPPSTANVVPSNSGIGRIPFSLTSEAIAQGPMIESEASTIHGRKVLIEIDRRFFIQGLIKDQLPLWYYYNQSNPKRILIPILSTFINEGQRGEGTSNRVFRLQLDIPKTAKAFLIQVETQYSGLATLSTTPNSTKLYKLQYTKRTWSGLWKAFGRRSVSTYQIQLHHVGDSLIRLDNRAEFIERRGKYNWFKWETFVDATKAQLDDIAEVEYKLHRTFSPEPPVRNRSTRFLISREGWGSFWVHAIISHSNSNRKTHIQYYLDL